MENYAKCWVSCFCGLWCFTFLCGVFGAMFFPTPQKNCDQTISRPELYAPCPDGYTCKQNVCDSDVVNAQDVVSWIFYVWFFALFCGFFALNAASNQHHRSGNGEFHAVNFHHEPKHDNYDHHDFGGHDGGNGGD